MAGSDSTKPDASGVSAPSGGWPDWFDPSRDAVLTPKRLRGLVHPIRVRLLNLLETDGPATATQLGRRTGESSGVTSYHLRVLAEHGYVEEDTERGNGRDRWWRPKYRATSFTFRSPDDPGDSESVLVAEQFMQIVAAGQYERMLSFINSLARRLDQLPTSPWTFSDTPIELTHEQARALAAEVTAVVGRYRREAGEPPAGPGAVRAVFQFQMLPEEGPA